jgi:hypothetical protein
MADLGPLVHKTERPNPAVCSTQSWFSKGNWRCIDEWGLQSSNLRGWNKLPKMPMIIQQSAFINRFTVS